MKKILLSGVVAGGLLVTNAFCAEDTSKVLHKIIEDDTTVLVDEEYINSLSVGWSMVGVEHKISNMQMFNNANTVWIYNNGWKAYSPNETTKTLINNSGISSFTEIDAGSGFWVNIDKILPKIDSFTTNSMDYDSDNNQANLNISTNVLNIGNGEIKFYNNGSDLNLSSGTYLDGNLTLPSGNNNLQVCIENDTDNVKVCKTNNILVEGALELDYYSKIELDYSSLALSTYDNKIVSSDKNTGKVYLYDTSTQENTEIFDVGYKVNGITYLNNYFYISSTSIDKVKKYDTEGNFIEDVKSFYFPDGIGTYNNLLYVVQNDDDENLAIVNPDTKSIIGTVKTGVPDIVGVVSQDTYLYILGENGDIYQYNTITGESIKFFNNTKFTGSGNYGLEGITILGDYIYVTYVNDGSLYKIDIPLK
ncbi:MAG: hypothetical protein U9N59_07365 [Campylobacterota bacterium]|nr:hypothetical protein [Campylobacterota bacterium]